MLILLEGFVMCFILLLICVIGIANGPVGLVVFYEKDVQYRVVELGYTKAWIIPKTEDLQTYIPKAVMIKKWVGTMIGFPIIAAIIAGIMTLI